ncbi:PREDICTED: transmembrane glycoprotein NMB isoform X1 [Cyprinodon variegatus]|uniref:transmembrane glycoprotein NMB isoform X1 n=1 Tax=Cyprinodon variegatus TaxID=28743 RepID=UPI00074269FF|nr:PREDICTED: transmembrane glycoprotein NMB isoform X1 [Cyprinodon variegatus]
MRILQDLCLLAFYACCVYQADARQTYRDVFPHKHSLTGKFPFPIPPIPGWEPDTNPWDDYLYPPLNSKPRELMHHRGKPKVRLTSDSPAINGSCITFTAKLEYPPCQREDANGDLVWDEHCEDGTELEASANGQLRSGYVYNWTSWLDDYGFGKCTDKAKCNVFPDGKPFPQSNDWRRKSYVYVWHTMGQYYETCDGSSSSVTINTTNIPLGAEVMEVMVYRKRERRKYSPLTNDNTVFLITDKIPLAVDISQKSAVNKSANVFIRGEEMVFKVRLHDPSGYLKTAASVDYIWDFKDGNQLVTHREVTTHTYSTLGIMNVKLVVEAAFPVECPPASATPTPRRPTSPPLTVAPTTTPATHAVTTKIKTTSVPPKTSQPIYSSTSSAVTTGLPTTEPLPSTVATESIPTTTLPWLKEKSQNSNECFRYAYGTFSGNITIVEPKHPLRNRLKSRIVDVSAARVTNTDINFLVKCLGSIPTSACTIVSDPSCTKVRNIMCNDVPPSTECEVHLRRRFLEPGTYCVNITLESSKSMALASTTITISKSQDTPVPETPNTARVVLTSSAVLVAVFAMIAYVVYRRHKLYRPIRRSLVEDACARSDTRGPMVRLREALFPSSEESRHLLHERHPL